MEIRIFGSPGCGKTHYLCNTVIPDMSKEYNPDKIMITSFTKTAAIEIAKRAGLKPEDPKHGTLHAICYGALGKPTLVDTMMKEWNDQFPNWKMSGTDQQESNKIISDYNVLRNKLVPIEIWPKNIQDLHKEWLEFKKETNTIDFTDMIEIGLKELIVPPYNPSVIIADECQDFTPLQMKLIRSWGIVTPKVFLCLDDDQSIYSFSGVDINNILIPDVPKEQKIFLKQSFRVPSLPHAFAIKITDQIQFREEKTYNPIDKRGSIEYGRGSMLDPTWMIDDILKSNDSVMIMTSCSYMLRSLTEELRLRGIPFHNPYKPQDKTWNPLSCKASNVLYNFLSTSDDKFWSTEQLLQWISHIKMSNNNISGLIPVQAPKLIKMLTEEFEKGTEGLHTCREYISDILSPIAMDLALKRDVEWLMALLKSDVKNSIDYPLTISKSNIEFLNPKSDIKPQIALGTIHSFKGTEAERVYVFPDISWAATKEWQESTFAKDNLHRLFYVAVTRTKDKLIIMPPVLNSKSHYNFPILHAA